MIGCDSCALANRAAVIIAQKKELYAIATSASGSGKAAKEQVLEIGQALSDLHRRTQTRIQSDSPRLSQAQYTVNSGLRLARTAAHSGLSSRMDCAE